MTALTLPRPIPGGWNGRSLSAQPSVTAVGPVLPSPTRRLAPERAFRGSRTFFIGPVVAPAVLGRVRETAPVVLVPAAWTVVTLAHSGTVTERTLLIAHVVMDVLLVAFAALSWSDMTEGALRSWRTVLVAGLVFTLAGTYGLATDGDPALLALTVYAWMLLPAAALAHTGQLVPPEDGPRVYTTGAILSGVGAVLYLGTYVDFEVATVAGLALVGAGQTAGIVNAAVQ